MKTLYLECNMGAAGDMLMAALTELMPDKDAFVKEVLGEHISSKTDRGKRGRMDAVPYTGNRLGDRRVSV